MLIARTLDKGLAARSVRLLALDTSTHVGFSLWDGLPPAPTKLGTWHAPSAIAGNYGRRFKAFHNWLCDMITVHEPEALAFESPLTGGPHMNTTEDILRLLIGLASVAELVAELRGLRCFEVHGTKVKMALAGTGRIPSKDKDRVMIAAAHEAGYLVGDSHQADSCGVALTVYSDLGLLDDA